MTTYSKTFAMFPLTAVTSIRVTVIQKGPYKSGRGWSLSTSLERTGIIPARTRSTT